VVDIFKMFQDEVAARRWLEDIRWPKGNRHCPHYVRLKNEGRFRREAAPWFGTQKTAWLLAQKIRQGWIDGGGNISREVGTDETFMGGKKRDKHKRKRLVPGGGSMGKAAVIGARTRGWRDPGRGH